MLNYVGLTTVTINGLIIYYRATSLTAVIVTESPFTIPCGIGVVMTVGLIDGIPIQTTGGL